MRKLLAIAFALIMVLSLFGCNKSPGAEESTETVSPYETVEFTENETVKFEDYIVAGEADFVYSLCDGGVKITGYNGYNTENFAIPSEIDGNPVVAIGNYAFREKTIVSLVIPDTVTYIEGKTFQNCKQLEKIYIPAECESIEYDAFDGDDLLTIYAPENSRADAIATTYGFVFIPYTFSK